MAEKNDKYVMRASERLVCRATRAAYVSHKSQSKSGINKFLTFFIALYTNNSILPQKKNTNISYCSYWNFLTVCGVVADISTVIDVCFIEATTTFYCCRSQR
jgi:hypothetical protein